MLAFEPKIIAESLAAFLTPVIALTTTVIVVNQYLLARKKLRLDLFERRYAVYEATMEYVTRIMQEGKSSSEAQANFLRNTKDRVFLFDKKVHQLDEVWEKSIRLETYQEIFNNLVGPERTKYVEAAGKVKLELPELVTRAQELFGRDLRMS